MKQQTSSSHRWRVGARVWLFAGFALLSQACMFSPTDGTRVANTGTAISFQGYYLAQSASVSVEAFNVAGSTWETIGTTTSSASLAFTTTDGYDLYSWSLGSHVLPAKYWKAENGGAVARVRARVGGITLPRLTSNLEGCFDGGISYTRLASEDCYTWRSDVRIYAGNHTIAPGCPNASGSTTQGHYLLHSMPACAQQTVYDKIGEHIDAAVIAAHYEILHANVQPESMEPINYNGETYEMGGLFGGHKRYIQRMRHRVSVHGYSWMPLGRIPAWDPGTNIPVPFRTPIAAPGGAANNCQSQSPGCSDWDSTPVVDWSPNRPKPANLNPGAVCSQPNVGALAGAVMPWHGNVHVTVGGAFGNFDSPSNPLFFLWHNYLNDVWEDWQDCP